MEVQFRTTESDYLAARLAWSLALWPVLLLYLVMHPFYAPALRGFVVVALWDIGEVLLIRWQWQKQFAKSNIANTEVSATIDERGVTLCVHGEQKTYWWAGFSQIYESSRVVVFERPYADVLYVPKRAMSTAQLTELVRIASIARSQFCKVRLASPLG
jgi:hypothetical protein